jgi:PAS domain S-box-containing protein
MVMEKKKPATIPQEMFEALSKAFEDFQIRAEKLSVAYQRMQEDFKKVNIELDSKNEQLAQSLKKQEEIQLHLNSILESMNNGVIGINIMERITHFNRAASDITGYSSGEVLDKKYSDFFSKGVEEESSLLQVLRTGRGLNRDEKAIRHKTGHPLPVSFQTALLRDPSGAPIGAVEIFSDISRIKALEEEMQQAKTMAAIGEMAATMAHEIRNPLGAMGMWADLLGHEIPEASDGRKHLNRIVEGLGRMNRIVSNLLVYSRPVKPQLRRVALDQILSETVDFVGIEIERQEQKVRLVKMADGEAVFVDVDPEKLQQVIMNLSLNAVQAMPKGGTLTVKIDRTSGAQQGFVSFSISDTGSGIAPENLGKIFDPFFTTKANGTGLGLAIVKKIVESHAGYIDVNSKPDEGTTVQVFLPRASRATP